MSKKPVSEEVVEKDFEVISNGEAVSKIMGAAEVQALIDTEYKDCTTQCCYYKGVYLGDFDYEHLLKLAKILTGRVLNKGTKNG